MLKILSIKSSKGVDWAVFRSCLSYAFMELSKKGLTSWNKGQFNLDGTGQIYYIEVQRTRVTRTGMI